MDLVERYRQRQAAREAAHVAVEHARTRLALTGTAAEQKAADRIEARLNPLPTCVFSPDDGRGAEFTPDASTARLPDQDGTAVER